MGEPSAAMPSRVASYSPARRHDPAAQFGDGVVGRLEALGATRPGAGLADEAFGGEPCKLGIDLALDSMPDEVDLRSVIREGNERTREIAAATLDTVHELMHTAY
jgi:hypothetical protein